MSGIRCAWAVVVPKDEDVTGAILTGMMLRRTQTTGVILAVFSNQVSKLFVSRLDGIFDMVIAKDISEGKGLDEPENLLLQSVSELRFFENVVALRPGVAILRQSDNLFDCKMEMGENQVMLNDAGSWTVAVMNISLCSRHWTMDVQNGPKIPTICDINDTFPADQTRQPEIVWVDQEFWDAVLSQLSPGLPPSSSLASPWIESANWIAIVGMSCRFPEANSLEEYWDILDSGRTTSSSPPEIRLSLVNIDKTVKANFLKCPIDQFDASFFGISPSEAAFMDPQARLLLDVSWEAFENAGIVPETLKGSSTGVFCGAWLQEYLTVMNSQYSDPSDEFLRKYLGNGFGCTGAKLSFFYGFTGPNISTESGCSSSMVALDLACKSLQRRECPVALAAGANIFLQFNMKKKVLWAEDGRSKTFDAGADGYGRAEGIAVLVLKRFSDAVRDGDRIHGIIRGTAASQEELSKSFETPKLESEYNAMSGALRSARVDPAQVDYVEAHATGTSVGDPIEAAAIVRAYSSRNQRERKLLIGSGKTNIGHTESCAGMAGMIKVLLAMKHELIPAHVNLTSVNPQVNFDPIQGEIHVRATPWPRSSSRTRMAGVSSFGITGTDVHLILQEPPPPTTKLMDPPAKFPNVQIMAISAKSQPALLQLCEAYANKLETISDDDLNQFTDFVYSVNTTRTHHLQSRKALLASGPRQATRFLRDLISKATLSHATGVRSKISKSDRASNICFAFPGIIGNMDFHPAQQLYKLSTEFRLHFDHCSATWQKLYPEKGSLVDALLANISRDEMGEPISFYASYLAIQYSLVMLWKRWGVNPGMVLGHCLGELSACLVSGVLSLENAFKILTCMEIFIYNDEVPPGSMLAMYCDEVTAQNLIDQFLDTEQVSEPNNAAWIDIAGINTPTQTVVAASTSILERFQQFSENVRSKLLSVDFAVHSRVLDVARESVKKMLEGMDTNPPKIPYISGVTGKLVHEEDVTPEFLFGVFRDTVQFNKACEAVMKPGENMAAPPDTVIEIGLGTSMAALVKENVTWMSTTEDVANVAVLSSFQNRKGHEVMASGEEVFSGLLPTLAGIYMRGGNIDWKGFYMFDKDHRSMVDLPHYPFQRKSFWFEKKSQQLITISDNGNLVALEQVHPLLGGNFRTVLENIRIYQNCMRDKVSYIYDHVIGTHVIFPAAGHLEMMLAACRREHRDSLASGHFVIEDFAIHIPLYMKRHSDDARRLQIVLDTTTKRVTIHASNLSRGGEQEWIKFASGTVSFRQELLSDSESLKSILAGIIKTHVGSEQVASQFYSEIAEVGLNFGPAFKSIKRVFRTEQKNETLMEINFGDEMPPEGNYVAHPILLDAMIQGFMLHSKPKLSKLHVPVSIKKMIWIPSEYRDHIGQQFFVYCRSEATGITHNTYLLNENGSVVCVMMQLELAVTTVQSVLQAAGVPPEEFASGALKLLPTVYQVDWQDAKRLQMKESLDLCRIVNITSSTDFQNVKILLEQKNCWTLDQQKLEDNVNKLCYLYVLKALYELGWIPEAGKMLPDFSAIVVPGLRPSLKHYLTFLVEQSILEAETFLQIDIPPSQIQAGQVIERLISHELRDYPAIEIIHACGSQLAAILQGHITAQYVLFGSEKDGSTYAELFYKLTRFNYGMFQAPAAAFLAISRALCSTTTGKTKCLRNLEVGSGTGSFTTQVLGNLAEQEIHFHYVFTDISPSFFSRAQNKFGTYVASGQLEFKVLDIERDPLEQDFPPNYFDIVVGVDVFHATRRLKRTMGNVRKVVRKGGMLVIGETVKPVRELDICFGILDGYWLYEDSDMRSGHCTVNAERWKEILEEVGFGKEELCDMYTSGGQMSVITARNSGNGNEINAAIEEKEWAIFHDDDDDKLRHQTMETKLDKLGRRVSYLNVATLFSKDLQDGVVNFLAERKDRLEGILFWSRGECCELSKPKTREILEPLLCIAKFIGQCRWKRLPKLYVITSRMWSSRTHSGGDMEETAANPNCDASLLWGFMRTFRVELPQLHSKCIDLDGNAVEEEQVDWILNEMWSGEDPETEILFRNGARLVRRLRVQKETPRNALKIPSSCYKIQLPASKIINDLKYVPKEAPSLKGLEDNQVEIRVKSASLNFKDVMCIMKPSKDFEHATTIGLDFSGVISAVGGNVSRSRIGDPVFGCNWTEGTITNHLVSNADLIMGLPETLTFSEAAALPVVFVTAWHCMVSLAQMKTGQSILIHAASGGVGLMAIQIAKYLGVEVFATAGSERKRNFVRSLGVQHVFNSRTLEYGEKVKDFTGGQGVDMILNCLTGPGFKETSLGCCKSGGYFVEISKLDIWSEGQVQEKRPDVQYHIVDVLLLDTSVLAEIFSRLTAMLENGSVRQLQHTRYAAGNIVDALTFLQKAKQIGKVIVEMPELDSETGEVKQNLFNERSSYMITGGRGSIGLAVAKWMVENGAKCLILVGRSPANDEAKQVIRELMEQDSDVVVITKQCDISMLDQCLELFENLRKDHIVPPVRGVHHCAGVLADKQIMNQDWSAFETVLAPKVNGAYNLHQATKMLPLEFFVLYSSMSSTFVNAGQSNYSAANCYMDALVERRRTMGLPGLSVNFGQWNAGLAQNLKLDWTEAFSITQGIQTLDKLMRERATAAVVGNLKFPGVLSLYPKYEDTLFENLLKTEAESKSATVKDDRTENQEERGPTLFEILMERKRGTDFSQETKYELIRNCVTKIICNLLGVNLKEIEPDVQFSDMGMDSIMSIEFTNKLQVEMGDAKLGFVDMDQHGSVKGMTSLIVSIFDEECT